MAQTGMSSKAPTSVSASGNVLPSASRYPQPKSPGSVGSGQTNIAPESKEQMKSYLAPSGYKHNSSRPKGR